MNNLIDKRIEAESLRKLNLQPFYDKLDFLDLQEHEIKMLDLFFAKKRFDLLGEMIYDIICENAVEFFRDESREKVLSDIEFGDFDN